MRVVNIEILIYLCNFVVFFYLYHSNVSRMTLYGYVAMFLFFIAVGHLVKKHRRLRLSDKGAFFQIGITLFMIPYVSYKYFVLNPF